MSWRPLALAGLAAAFCAGATAQDRELAPGVTERAFALEAASVHLVQVDPGGAEIRIVSPQTRAYTPAQADEDICDGIAAGIRGPGPASRRTMELLRRACREQLLPQQATLADGLFLLDLVQRHQPTALLSGGYLQSFSPPQSLGFLKVAGDQLNAPHRSWLLPGLFCTDGREWTIAPVANLDETRRFGDCLQAGPFLVREGADRYRLEADIEDAELKLAFSEQAQAFICVTAEGRALLGYAGTMAASRLSAFAADELGCVDALRLSGHDTAGLWLGGELHGKSEVPLTNAIAVFPAGRPPVR